MNNPLLSICIATYNRAAFIGETLESIIPQINEDVEIVIVDGASTDDTSSVVQKYVNGNSQIKYFQLSAKGGVDQDYCKAVEYAKGEMCWLFTDDDLVKPGAIERLLVEIKKGFSLIVLNSEIRSVDFSTEVNKSFLTITEDTIFHPADFDNLFKTVIPYLSFIGGVIINRELWLGRDQKSYFGSEFVHVGVIFQLPLPGNTLVIAKPYITIRLGNAQWTARSFEIWIFKWPKLLSSFVHLSDQTKKPYSLAPSFRRFRNIVVQRSKDGFNSDQYKVWLNKSQDAPSWWNFLIKIVSLTPVPFLKLCVNGYVKLRRGL